MVETIQSRAQSSQIRVGFNSEQGEEAADKWISENKQADEAIGLQNHTVYKKEKDGDDWWVTRNFYYEERKVNGQICTGEGEINSLSDQSGSDSMGEGRENEVEASGV